MSVNDAESDRPPERRARRLRAERRRAARVLPARRRHHHADLHGGHRVLHGRPRRARDGAQPAQDVQGGLGRHRPELVLPVRPLPHRSSVHAPPRLLLVGHERERARAVQPHADAAADDDAHPHRARRRRSRSAAASSTSAGRASTSPARSSRSGSARRGRAWRRARTFPRDPRRVLAGAALAAVAGFLKATVGAHEVITTIMLNWIAYWVGSYLFGRGGPLQNSVDISRARCRATSCRAASCRRSGATRSCRRSTSASSSRSARSSSSG